MRADRSLRRPPSLPPAPVRGGRRRGERTPRLIVLCLLSLLAGACRHAGARPTSFGPLERSPAALARAVIRDESRLVLRDPRHRFPLTVPRGAVLELGFGIDDSLWDRLQAVEFRVFFEDRGGRETLLDQRVLPPGWVGENRWHDVTVSLDALAGRTGTLVLAAAPTPALPAPAQGLRWTNLVLAGGGRGAAPSLILLSIDTLRADHLGCYGYARPTSTTIDRIARQGVRFANAIASSSWTLPSHASLFTGLDPSGHAAERRGRLAGDLTTLGELLWAHGYRTAAFTGGGYVGPTLGFDQGFDRYRGPGFFSPKGKRLKHSVEQGMRWAAAHATAPFFLFLHTYAVHMPYTPPVPYDSLFDPGYDGPYRRRFLLEDYDRHRNARELPAATLRHIEALYDGEIAYLNALLAGPIESLTTEPLAANTCLIVTSDHGEEFMEHGTLLHHHAKLFEELVRIPLIFWCPSRFPGGRVVDEPVSLADVMPTVLELAGIPVPPGLDGRSLLPALMGRPLPPGRVTVSEVDGLIEGQTGSVWSLRTDAAKLIHSTIGGSPVSSLFDLKHDPGEQHNVIADHPAAEALTAALRRMLARRGAAPGAAPVRTPSLAPAVREQLRALGYVN